MEKTVFVTGASSGIGMATAKQLVLKGYHVLAAVRNVEKAKFLEKDQILSKAEIIEPLDLSLLEEVDHRAEEIKEKIDSNIIPPLYGVILIAGGGHVAPIELMDIQRLKTEIDVRVLSSVRLLQFFIPLLRRTKGKIIWIATPGLVPVPYVADIHACDFAVNYLARTLNVELKPDGIRNILVRCGGIDTPAGKRTEKGIFQQQCSQTNTPVKQLYEKRLDSLEKKLHHFDMNRSDPNIVGEKIVSILSIKHPKIRYQIGYLSKLGSISENLPQWLVDKIMLSRESI